MSTTSVLVEPRDREIDLHIAVLEMFQAAFRRSPGNMVTHFIAASRAVQFVAGTVVYELGDAPDNVYVMISGAVELSAAGEKTWRFKGSSVWGLFDVEHNRPRTRTALITEDAHVLVLRADDWFDLLEDHFELTRARLQVEALELFELSTSLTEREREVDGLQLGGFPTPRTEPQAATRQRLNRFERMLCLRHSCLFQRARVQPLIHLGRLARNVHLRAGEPLFCRGERADSVFIVAEGAVQVTSVTPPIDAVFVPGELVGATVALGCEQFPLDARAHQDSLLLAIDKQALFDVMEDHFDVVRAVRAYFTVERERLQRLRAPSS